MASLLPVPKARFFDASGAPLAGGKVYTYTAGTTIPLSSYTDVTGMTPNTNPVILNAAGEADIWLVGIYNIVLKDVNDVQQWQKDNIADIQTQIGNAYGAIMNVYAGTSAGTANSIVLTPNPPLPSYAAGQTLRFTVFQNNTAGATVNVSNLGDKNIRKFNGVSLVSLVGGDLRANTIAEISYDGTQWILSDVRPFAQGSDVASAASISLNAARGNYLNVTGTTPVSSITLDQGQWRRVVAVSGFTLINSASLITPDASNLQLNAGDVFDVTGEALGVVRVTMVSAKSAYKAQVINGLTLSNNATDTTNDIDIAIGAAYDANGATYRLATGITRQLDVLFGTGNGGLFTGAIANGTYHIWLIKNDTTGAIDAGFDTSVTGANVPTGWSKICRMGSILRIAGSIVQFIQTGDDFDFLTQINNYTTVAPTITKSLYDVSVPLGLILKAKLRVGQAGTSNGGKFVTVFNPAANEAVPTDNFCTVASGSTTSANNASAQVSITTDVNGKVAAIANVTSISFYIATYGYMDTRGR